MAFVQRSVDSIQCVLYNERWQRAVGSVQLVYCIVCPDCVVSTIKFAILVRSDLSLLQAGPTCAQGTDDCVPSNNSHFLTLHCHQSTVTVQFQLDLNFRLGCVL